MTSTTTPLVTRAQLLERRGQIMARMTELRAEVYAAGARGETTMPADTSAEIEALAAERNNVELALERTAAPAGPSRVHTVGLTGASRDVAATGMWVRDSDGLPAAAEPGRYSEHPIVARHREQRAAAEQAITGMHSGIGSQVRAMSTTSGSAVVPTVWADQIIDRARNASRVLQAGAQVIPMDAKTVQIGRLTTDPTAAFRAEGSTVTASDPVFDNVTLTATTMSALVVGSMEWFQDAANVDEVVSEAIAKAIGLQLDLAALYGSITSGSGTINLPTPSNPRGVLGNLLANASSNVFAAATNGTPVTTYAELLDLLYTVRDGNFEPNALIWNSKLARKYAKLMDTTNQPMQLPPDVANVDRLTSNQIPSFTQGTSTGTATDAFAGQWDQLLIGQRLGLTVQTLTERYAELGQVAIIAHWRGDVQCAQPRAFSVYRALVGS